MQFHSHSELPAQVGSVGGAPNCRPVRQQEWVEALEWDTRLRELRQFPPKGWFRIRGNFLWLSLVDRGLLLDWPSLVVLRDNPREGGIVPLPSAGLVAMRGRQVLWQPESGKALWSQLLRTTAHPHLCRVRWDGRELALYNREEGRIEVFALPAAEQSWRGWLPWEISPTQVRPAQGDVLAYHPRTQQLIYDNQEGDLVWWSGRRLGSPQHSLRGSVMPGHCSQAFDPEGRWLALGTPTGLTLWDTQNHTGGHFEQHGCALNLAWLRWQDQLWLASSNAQGLRLFRLEGEQLRLEAQSALVPACMQWLNGGNQPTLVWLDWDGLLGMLTLHRRAAPMVVGAASPEVSFRWAPSQVLQEWMNSDIAEFRSQVQTTQAEQVVDAAGVVVAGNLAHRWSWFARSGGEAGGEEEVPPFGERSEYQHLAISACGTRVAVGRRFQIRHWRREASKWILEPLALGDYSRYYQDSMEALAFLDSQQLAALCSKGLYRYHLELGSYALEANLPVPVELACISGRQGLIYGSSAMARIEILEDHHRVLDGWSSEKVKSLALSPGGLAAWTSRQGLWWRSGQSPQRLGALPLGNENPTLCFLDDNRLLLSCSPFAFLYRLPEGSPQRLKLPGPVLGTCPGGVYCRSPEGFVQVLIQG